MANYTYDAQDVTQGGVADAAYVSGSGTLVALLKGIFNRLLLLNVAAGAAVALTTPSGTLSSGDNALAVSGAVRHIWIENNSGAAIGYAMDGAASAGSRQCPTGWARILDEPCSTAVHIFAAGSTPYNGTAGSNVVVLCWA
jgi:hypothetical protein